MRAAFVALAVLLLAFPLAGAQQRINPICTGTPEECGYEDIYVVYGRILDAGNQPLERGKLRVSVDGVGNSEVDALTDCKGDLIVPYQKFYRVDESRHRVRVTVLGRDGYPDETFTSGVDAFYRRSDALHKLSYADDKTTCPPDEYDVPFEHKITIKGRLLSRTGAYERNGEEFHAVAYDGPYGGIWEAEDGRTFCFPSDTATGGAPGCEIRATDDRGDLAYTWTFPNAPVVAGGTVRITLENRSYTADVDPVFRVAILKAELTGQGPPAKPAPAPGLLVALAVVAGAAVARSLLLRRAR